MRQTEEEDLQAGLQQSRAPFHVAPPTTTSLIAFYGSLESLWLLLTQWDSLLMGDGGAGGVSSDRGRATLHMRIRTAVVAPLGDFTHLIWSLFITVGRIICDFGSFLCLFRLFHMEWDFAQLPVKWNPKFHLKRERYN